MKKVMVVSTVGLIYDGITSVIVSYLEAMDRRDLDIYVVSTIKAEAAITKKIEKLGCHVISFPSRRTNTAQYFFSLLSFIRKNRIDVIHAHGNSATLSIEMLAGWLGGCKKRIAHSHNTKCDQVKADKILRPFFYRLYTEALACGQDAGKWLFGDRKFEILQNGRDVDKYAYQETVRKNMRENYGFQEQMVVGHVGGFYEQKNHRFLVQVFRSIQRHSLLCLLHPPGS